MQLMRMMHEILKTHFLSRNVGQAAGTPINFANGKMVPDLGYVKYVGLNLGI